MVYGFIQRSQQVYWTKYVVYCTMYNVHCTMYTVHTVQCTVCIIHCTIYSVHSTIILWRIGTYNLVFEQSVFIYHRYQ